MCFASHVRCKNAHDFVPSGAMYDMMFRDRFACRQDVKQTEARSYQYAESWCHYSCQKQCCHFANWPYSHVQLRQVTQMTQDEAEQDVLCCGICGDRDVATDDCSVR